MPDVFAPARVNLIGEHTDYSGGLVLPVAIDLGTTVAWQPGDDGVRVRSTAVGAVGWERYVEAVVGLLGEAGRPDVGIDATVDSTVPLGAGLSSSAALTVSLSLALCSAASFEIEPMALAKLCQEAERVAVGVPCGLMDPATALLARRGHALLLDCGTEEHRHVPLPEGVAIVVIDSGIRHSLEHSGYAERRAEVERGDPRRMRHVRSENERVRRTVAALERGDLAALGPIFRAAHDSLRDDFEVSTPELDLLVDRAYAHGAIAARMTGGGFGGSIVALVERDRAAAFAQAAGGAGARVCATVDGAAALSS
jgi:galactokinase